MKRYNFMRKYDGDWDEIGEITAVESPEGEYVRYEDALAEMAAERERIRAAVEAVWSTVATGRSAASATWGWTTWQCA